MDARPPLSSFVGTPQNRPPLSSFMGNQQPVQSPQPSQPKSIFGNLALGAGKGLINTFSSIGKMGASLVGKIPIPAVQQQAQQSIGLFNKAQQGAQSQNLAQSIGKGAEQVGEFFLPGGAEKNVFEKGAQYIDKLPELLGLGEKLSPIVTGALKVALRSAITGGSTAGVTAAQGGTGEQVKTAGVVGGLAGAAGEALDVFGKGLRESLQKADFKMSPMQEAKAAKKVQSAAEFMTSNKILGTDETKYTKLVNINNSLEEALQSSLPKNAVMTKQAIIDDINNSLSIIKKEKPAIYKEALSDANDAIELLQSEKGKTISIEDALNSKRSYGEKAFKQSRLQVKDAKVASEGNYSVEHAFQKGIEDTLNTYGLNKINIPKELQGLFGGKSETTFQDFNKVYSNAITSKILTNVARFKTGRTLIGTLASAWIGETVGSAIVPGIGGKIGGLVAGEMLASKIPGAVRYTAERALSNPKPLITGAAKTGLSLFNKNQNQ